MEREKQRRLEEVERLRQERKRREEGEADRKVRGVVKVGIYDDTNYILYYKVLGCGFYHQILYIDKINHVLKVEFSDDIILYIGGHGYSQSEVL